MTYNNSNSNIFIMHFVVYIKFFSVHPTDKNIIRQNLMDGF